jgi:hypothetical protein
VGRGTLLALACALLALAGCGGGGSDSNQSIGSTTEQASPQAKGESAEEKPRTQSEQKSAPQKKAEGPPASDFQPKPHHDSGGGSEQFTSPGGDNSVQEYGSEAKGEEFQAAASALHHLLDARAERNWAAACRYLSSPAKQGLAALGAKVPELKGRGCAIQLGALTGSISNQKLREAAIANVASVRVQGDHGVVIYRGAQGQVEAVTMAREGGEWKVASLSAVPLG